MHTTRRNFLKSALGASTLLAFGPAAPDFLRRSALAGTSRERAGNSSLVAVQLSGGNDGLNTLVPFQDDEYHRNRPTLRLPRNQIHKIDAQLGFHPEMAAFYRLYREGCLTIVQGVGYPNSSRDHDDAMRDWHTARPKEAGCTMGWMGRAIDQAYEASEANLPGLFIGSIKAPFGLQAEKAVVPSITSLQQLTPPSMLSRNDAGAFRRPLAQADAASSTGVGQPLLRFLEDATLDAQSTGKRVEAVIQAQKAAGTNKYPPFQLAQTLSAVAQLIRADIGIRIYCAELGGGGIGGFDTHANQAANHGALLRQLAESVAAFVDDLQQDQLLDRVLLMTFSEFGRTVAENGRRGTDHGAAAPLFLAGGRLKIGLVGSHPSLKDLAGGALKFHTDFRRIYATVLGGWLGFDSHAILGQSFQPIEVFRSQSG